MNGEIAFWDRLSAIASLGTRRGFTTDSIQWPDSSLEAANTASPEKTLLRAAAAAFVWSRVGHRIAPRATAPSVLPPEIDPASIASEAAALRLVRMIGGDRRELIDEWFDLANAAGRVLPQRILPLVLEGIAPKIRNKYPRVLGPAATWLASLNTDWTVSTFVTEPSEQRWLEGTLEERRAELECLRRIDPARATQWVQSTWATDPPEAREAFVNAHQIGLSGLDEPFLESALDDKRKAVRQAAVAALARLPQSAHALRNYARLAPLIDLEAKSGGLLARFTNRKLIVTLPTGIDKTAQRDGIELKPPAQRKIGERAFWLTQMVALASPRHWNERFDCDARTFTAAVMANDHGPELLSALSEAAVRHENDEWLEALCEAWLESGQEQHIVVQAIARLIGSMQAGARAAMLEKQVRKLVKRNVDAFLFLLESIDTPWTPSMTELAIDYLAGRARAEQQSWAHPRNTLDSWGRRCDLATAARLLPSAIAAAGDTSPWRNAMESMYDLVEFRAGMQRELT